MKIFAWVLAALSLTAGTLPADTTGQITPEERRSLEVSPAVVFIRVWYTFSIPGKLKETPIGFSGTGFLYRPDGYLITNAHVVEDANLKDPTARTDRMREVVSLLEHSVRRRLTLPEIQSLQVSDSHLEVYLSNFAKYTGEIKVYSDPSFVNNGKDIAIIKIDGNNLPTVKLGDSENVHVGEPLTVIGYPGVAMNSEMISKQSVLVPSVTNGHISALKVDYKGTPVLQSDVAITHGNSGGPAFDPDGKVVGIATYGNVKEVAGFNFFVPINTALEFVRQAGAEPQSGEFDRTWQNALDAYSQGDWPAAHRLLNDVLAMSPGQPDATRLQNVAARNERNESSVDRVRHSAGPFLWPIAVGAILLIAFVAWRLLKPARPAPQPPSPTTPPALSDLKPTVVSPIPPPSGDSGRTNFGTLHVTAGALNGNRFPIPKAGLLIGRDSAKCNIVISDDTISKEHAWVVPLDHEVVVIDRGSSNGTYVNSTDSPRVNKVALKDGDRLFIGKKGAVLTFQGS